MAAKRRAPFRTLGMRMQAFGRSLMRHYTPPQSAPPVRGFTPPPIWQADTQTPLLWNEPEQIPLPPDENLPIEPPALEMEEPVLTPPPVQKPRPKASPVQRKVDTEEKIDPRLLAILAAHQERETRVAQIRERKTAAEGGEIQRHTLEGQGDASPTGRRRSRASFDYIETKALLPPDEEIGHAAPPKAPPADSIQLARLPDQPDRDDDEEESSPTEIPALIQQPPLSKESNQPPRVEPTAPPIVQRASQPPPFPAQDSPTSDAPVETRYPEPVPPEIAPLSGERETPVQSQSEAVQPRASSPVLPPQQSSTTGEAQPIEPPNGNDTSAPAISNVQAESLLPIENEPEITPREQPESLTPPAQPEAEQPADRLAAQPHIEMPLVQRETVQPPVAGTSDDLPEGEAGDQILSASLESSVETGGDTPTAHSPLMRQVEVTPPDEVKDAAPVSQQAEGPIFPAVEGESSSERPVVQRQAQSPLKIEPSVLESQSGVGDQPGSEPVEPSVDSPPMIESAGDAAVTSPLAQRRAENLPPSPVVNKEGNWTQPETDENTLSTPLSQEIEPPIFPTVEGQPSPAVPVQARSEQNDKADYFEPSPFADAQPHEPLPDVGMKLPSPSAQRQIEPPVAADEAARQGDNTPSPSSGQVPLEKAKIDSPLPTGQPQIESAPPDRVLPVLPVENQKIQERPAETTRQPQALEDDEAEAASPPDGFEMQAEAGIVSPPPESRPVEITRKVVLPEEDGAEETPPLDGFETRTEAGIVSLLPESRPVEIARKAVPPEEDGVGEASPPDVFEALAEAGMVSPPPGSRPVEIARQPEPLEEDGVGEASPPDVFEALVEAGMVSPPSKGRPEHGEIARKPMPLVSQPPVFSDRTPDRVSVHYAAPPDTIRREETVAPEQSDTTSQNNGGGQVDIDKLARDVYSALRNRLRVEKERRG
jgi:hypothetical protein